MYQYAVETRNLQQPWHAAVAEPFVVGHLRELGRHHVQRHPVCSRGDGRLRLHFLGSYPLQWPLLVQPAVGVLDRVADVFAVDVEVADAVRRAVVDSLQKYVHAAKIKPFPGFGWDNHTMAFEMLKKRLTTKIYSKQFA